MISAIYNYENIGLLPCLCHVNANKNFRQQSVCILSVLFNRLTLSELILVRLERSYGVAAAGI